ncbi:kanadaptin-like [Phalaenopsis equestris]|uniref:kanadaptin-like n=1 Tax=Phalaenopsis equestris TaxID=78828 RepID=UPI0009E23A03|nr:kanadaptin-like [Phalaenopsis equestris]
MKGLGSMGPPPPKNPSSPPNSDVPGTALDHATGEDEAPINEASGSGSVAAQEMENESPKEFTSSPSPNPKASSNSFRSGHAMIPYTTPSWSEPPEHPFSIEVLKDGTIIEELDVHEKGAYMFGRLDLCDFVLEHPTISRFHAVLQFKKGDTFVYDLDSTHGTFINKKQIKGKVYTEIHVGDVLRFGQSSRLYIFKGPSELMPPEGDLHNFRKVKLHEAISDREASLLRAKEAASLANGISWGMAEDAIEEDPESDADEITWQTYKGLLTERQEKTRSKIIKRMEKVSNMKKEIDAIRVKDISQGGLTQGQQMQIGRNEQRIAQIMEELDSLEETLNDSIRESKSGRARRSIGGRLNAVTEEEENTVRWLVVIFWSNIYVFTSITTFLSNGGSDCCNFAMRQGILYSFYAL